MSFEIKLDYLNFESDQQSSNQIDLKLKEQYQILLNKFNESMSKPLKNFEDNLQSFIQENGEEMQSNSNFEIDVTDFVVDYPVLLYSDYSDVE